jgi:hypothetical protein
VPMISLCETTSSNVTGLYFSTLYVLSVGRHLERERNFMYQGSVSSLPDAGSSRSLSRTALPFPLTADGKDGASESNCCISSSLSIFACRCVGVEVASDELDLDASDPNDARRAQPRRNPRKTLFLSHAQTIDKSSKVMSLDSFAPPSQPTTGLPRRRLHRSARWIDRGVRSACSLSFYHAL